MRFGAVHRFLTNALATFGVLALVTSGNLDRRMNAAILIGLAGAVAIPEKWRTAPLLRQIASFGPVALLAIQIIRLLAFDATVLDVAVEFAIALQIVRLATRIGAAHDQQVIILALLHLIAGTMLGGGISYGICFIGFILVIPGALVLSHLRREVEGNYRQGARDRTGLPVDMPRILRSRRVVSARFVLATCLLAVPILAFTALLFITFPRVGLSLLLFNRDSNERMVGFSDRIDLGEVGSLRADPTLALRVEIPDLPDPPPPRIELHLRGTAFDAYDGRAWSRTQTTVEPVPSHFGTLTLRRRPRKHRDRVMTIDLEPFDPPVLFIPRRTVALRMRPRGQSSPRGTVELFAGGEGEIRYRTKERGARYQVFLGNENERSYEVLSEEDRARYLQLPPNLSPRIGELARTIVANRTGDWEKAIFIQEHLREHYRYDLSSPSGGAENPLDDFLFNTRAGHCEFYSTAMVVMLRELGIPARNVTGFLGGTYNRFGNFYAVRQGDAHSWVEAFIDGLGWTTFDPTPAVDGEGPAQLKGVFATLRDFLEATSQRWDRHVIGYDLHQQVSTFQRIANASRKSGINLNSDSPRARAVGTSVLGLLLIGGAAFWYWRRRQGEPTSEPDPSKPKPSREQRMASSLYASLEQAMASQNIRRNPGTPPLRHAMALRATGHPLGPEILELTRIYLAVRFGGEPLTDEMRHDFEARIRRIRASRPLSKPAA